jgi:hypothetical protein
MKHLIYILVFGFLFTTCQKAEKHLADTYAGNWNFKVTYKNKNNFSQTKLRYEGNITNSKNELMITYGFTEFLKTAVNKDGILYASNGTLVGVIEQQVCLLDFDNHQYHITIEGNR